MIFPPWKGQIHENESNQKTSSLDLSGDNSQNEKCNKEVSEMEASIHLLLPKDRLYIYVLHMYPKLM